MESAYIKTRNILILSGVAGVLLLIAVVVFYYCHFSGDVLYEQDKWGQLGDFFGGILNPVYSLLAYLGLLATLALTYKANTFIHIENTRQRQIDKREEAYKIISNISNKIDLHLERLIKYPDPQDSFKDKSIVFTELLICNYADEVGWQVAENNQVFLIKLSAMFEFLTICLSKYRDVDSTEYIPNYYKALYSDVVTFLDKYHKVSSKVVDFFKI